MRAPKRGYRKDPLPYSAGEKGRNRVRAYTDQKTGGLFLEWYEGARRRRVACGHQDPGKAKAQADQLAARLAEGFSSPTDELILGELFDRYLEDVTPTKTATSQGHDRQVARMFTSMFGRTKKVGSLSRREMDAFIQARRQGKVAGYPRRVKVRAVEYDLRTLRAMLSWATQVHDARRKGPLLDRDPVGDFKIPQEPSPRQVAYTEEQYLALLGVAEQFDWRFRLALVLANETGNRIGSILKLRWSDLELGEAGKELIHWRGENDKEGYDRRAPLSREAAAVLRAVRATHGGIGEAWVFPGFKDPKDHARSDVLRKILRRAEKAAGMAQEPFRGWHSFRRKFATDTKHLPRKDVMALAGWKSTAMLDRYTQTDETAQRSVLEHRNRMARTGS